MPVDDIVGIGFGPANIAMAVALEERGFDGRVVFLERRRSAEWQPEMLLEGSDIQNHPCRDLITPCNPRSRYTFLNFLHERGMLFEHLNLGIQFPLRREYTHYVAWVASHFARWVRYGSTVTSLTLTHARDGGALFRIDTADGGCWLARSVIVAPGRTAYVPEVFTDHLGPQVFHLTEYLARRGMLERERPLRHVAVVGGSQSAAEIVLDFGRRHPGSRISNVLRGYGYRLKDTSPFSERVYFPEFVDYFYNCDRQAKARLIEQLRHTNYSSVDGDVLHGLHLKLYEQKLMGDARLQLYTNREIVRCSKAGTTLSLTLREVNTGETCVLLDLDAIILATGFKDLGTAANQERYPAILEGIIDRLRRDDRGVLHVERDYRLVGNHEWEPLPPIYLNGLCESSHGFGDAGSFSLLSLRAAEIGRSLLRRLAKPEAIDDVALDDETATDVTMPADHRPHRP